MNLKREALTIIRERSGLSKSALAERAGVDRTLIHRLENGERNASPAVLRKLANALECPLVVLIESSSDPEAVA